MTAQVTSRARTERDAPSVPSVLHKFKSIVRRGSGWMARCPAHEDDRASLSIDIGRDGRLLLKCHAGCTFDDVRTAAGLSKQEVSGHQQSASGAPRIVATYDYRDEHGGALQYQSVRYSPKDFKQRRPDGAGGWIWGTKGLRRVLYRLSELQGQPAVFICEGEKDVDRLWTLGIPATTNVGGAGKWHLGDYTQQLVAAGCKRVIVLPDNDPPGAAHGNTVARSCHDAGLRVKLIPLPGLPTKGDVSDYFDRHSKEDFDKVIENAPVFDPGRRVAAGPALEFTSIADFLAESDGQVDWVVEDRIPAGGVVLFVGQPKAGKSTMARELGLAVSRGEPWLGWRTRPGPVWMLLFQDTRAAIRAHLRQMGATGTEPIRLFVGESPRDIVARLHSLATEEQPRLIVVDMLAGLLKARDFSDYAEITARFDPLLKLSRQTGAALVLLHHASMHMSRDGLDATLGSTALAGSVDNVLILRRTNEQRVLSSVQRSGPDLDPTVIGFDRETGRLSCAGSKRLLDDVELGERMLAALQQEAAAPVPESWIHDQVEGRHSDKVRVLRRLVGMRKVERFGAGGRKDPYRYAAVESGSGGSGRVTPDAEIVGIPGTAIEPENQGLFEAAEVLVPEVPYIYREQEEQEPSPSTYTDQRGCSLHRGAVPAVPDVPTTAINRSTGAQVGLATSTKQSAGSCSREVEFERF